MAVLKRSSQTLCIWFIACDLLMAGIAWIGAYWLRFDTGLIPITKPQPDFSLYWRALPIILICAGVAFRFAGQYEVHRLRRFREELVAVVKGAILLSLLAMATTFYRQDPYESRATMILFTVLVGVLILVTRRLTWGAVRWLRRQGFNQSNAIIVGTGRVARKTARALRHANWMGIRNIGFVEDQTSRWTNDLNILGVTDDLPKLIEKYKIEHVFIALPLNRFADVRKVYNVLAQSLVEVRLVADVPNLAGWTLTTSNLDGLPIIGLRESPHFGLNVIIKRGMDVTFSAIALVLLAPLMLLIAVAVKLSSPGPIFYRQERCSLNGKPFQMLKFRTMRADADIITGGMGWTVQNDPRVTPLGRFLRKTSLDELPQLLNVLWGDMSLVGPRPERPVFIRKFSKTIPNYNARHTVKCGITGWAQVHGWRGNTSLRKRVQYDLYYIVHWNPLLDLRILWMTLWHGVFHKNAY